MTQPDTTDEDHLIRQVTHNSGPYRLSATCTCGWRAFAQTQHEIDVMCELHIETEFAVETTS